MKNNFERKTPFPYSNSISKVNLGLMKYLYNMYDKKIN